MIGNIQSDDLAGDVLAAGLLVVHDTSGGGEDDVAELTRRQELGNPLLELTELDVVPGRDAPRLVDAAVKLDDDLAGAVVIHLLELSNVAWSRRQLEAPLDVAGGANASRAQFDLPCLCMTWRNLTMTLEDGLMRTCLFPAFSALLMAFRQSLRTEVLTIFAVFSFL